MDYWAVLADDRTGDEQKRVALGYITDAWIEAVKDGIDPDHMAEALLEVAMRELVALRSEAEVVRALAAYAQRIENGEFSTYATRQ